MFETYVDALMPKYTFPGQYESLAQIAALIRQATQELGLSSLDAYTVEMAVDEACTNIIEHAYGGEGLGEIELEYKIEADSLIIILRDHGKPFNPKKVRPPRRDVPLKRRRNRGLGLYFIHQWMDEVRFDFSEGTNTLTMVKRKR